MCNWFFKCYSRVKTMPWQFPPVPRLNTIDGNETSYIRGGR
jgi:hypothetical protein